MTKTATVHAQQRWEYSLMERRTETTLLIDINKEGDLGWELVQILKHEKPKGTFWTAFLKRPHTGPSRANTSEEKTTATGLEAAKVLQPSKEGQPTKTASSGAEASKSDAEESTEIFEFQPEDE